MDLAKAFGIKFIVSVVITASIFGIFYNSSLIRLFWMSLIVAGITFIADLFVLPRINKVVAVVADFGLFFLLYWGLASLLIDVSMPMVLASFAAAFFSAISESIIHIYMYEKVFEKKEHVPFPNELQTEFAKETDAQSITKNIKKDK
ncbi:membrane protein implicated in regulation of membrane protease activity [Virgibacillus halotolerans]|uniref:DUF2512 family protein n=1 Tax=Virgibacillus halotolerans TaxID=1071053 RepID=UPI00196029CA|nr:DUF2512 family protein [Virgibacillus halotolerans]MBM7599573.1 membrane protein implicated in regulation of membrane protease activity [Virgibacillus halotolerans]